MGIDVLSLPGIDGYTTGAQLMKPLSAVKSWFGFSTNMDKMTFYVFYSIIEMKKYQGCTFKGWNL